jgi:hypothetical protein
MMYPASSIYVITSGKVKVITGRASRLAPVVGEKNISRRKLRIKSILIKDQDSLKITLENSGQTVIPGNFHSTLTRL